MTDHACTTSRASTAGAAFEAKFGAISGAAFAAVARMVRAIRREIEIARATRAMADMPDHMLRDLGISRDQIETAARQGRREHGQRYL